MQKKPTYQELEKELEILKGDVYKQILLDFSGKLLVELNTNGIVTLVNSKTCEVLGYEEKEILGKNWFENFIPERLKLELLSIFKKLLSGKIKKVDKYENLILTKKGEERIIIWHNQLLKDNNGNVIGHLCLGEDITEYKKTGQQLKKQNEELRLISNELSEKNRLLFDSQKRFKNLFEQSPVSLWEEDFYEVIQLLKKKKKEIGNLKKYFDEHPDFVDECISKIKILNVNKVTLELLGVKTKEELISQIRKTNSKKAFEALKLELLSFVSNKKEFKGETEFHSTNGDVITVIVKSVLINEKGAAIASVIDITPLKKAEQELTKAKDKALKSEKKFRELYEKSSDSILIIENGTFVDCNKATVDLLGYKTKEEFLNTHPSKLSPEIQPDGRSSHIKAEEMIVAAFKNGTHRFEWIHTKSNGNDFPVEVLLTSIVNEPDNRVLHCVWRNITQRKKVELELITAKEKAEESDRLKTEFINNMSHEIRTPMDGILGFSQFLEDPNLTIEKRKHFVKIIQNSGNQLLHIIDDIIEISRLGTKQVKIHETEVCLNDVLLELFSIFDIKAKKKKIPLYFKKGLSNEQSIVFLDKSKIFKILSNLIENALKFTNKGFIEIGYNLKTDGETTELEIYIKDTGIGIKPEKHELIFERFSQAEKELSKNVGGLGLGLSIAKENTELIGGKIRVESEMMKGATFFITIPYKPINTISKNKDSKEKIISEQKKYIILIAEDEEVNYLFFEILLMDEIKLPCTLIHAKDGVEAVEVCKNNPYINFVLMDLKMPKMNGLDATKLIREFRPNLPIIAQTAYSTIEDKKIAISAGCNDFISKPITKEMLENLLKKYSLVVDSESDN
ncbi:PAS domain S-box protein [Lutibacter sp.]|uniref:PAS domain-containing hybrid sensor histidine kinase/response regulator n=1 Tax=Lutibacter sp. TaxID=1925666 RepID=UPI00273329AE|nr:PAS domain S-box protein [Lutibacter sp.]MDP3313865.1 PAS domain S-box protein [Lutibacter sp.]